MGGATDDQAPFEVAHGRANPRPEAQPKGTSHLKVDDIDDFYGAVLAHGFSPSTEPRKDRSGRREFLVLDPDEHRLAFFTK